MPLVLGLDLGTTTITALALDTESGEIIARQTTANDADVTAPDDRASGARARRRRTRPHDALVSS